MVDGGGGGGACNDNNQEDYHQWSWSNTKYKTLRSFNLISMYKKKWKLLMNVYPAMGSQSLSHEKQATAHPHLQSQ